MCPPTPIAGSGYAGGCRSLPLGGLNASPQLILAVLPAIADGAACSVHTRCYPDGRIACDPIEVTIPNRSAAAPCRRIRSPRNHRGAEIVLRRGLPANQQSVVVTRGRNRDRSGRSADLFPHAPGHHRLAARLVA